jgi:hypothetical protein
LRFNVFLSLPARHLQACYYNGHRIDAQKGSYVLSFSGLHVHRCDENRDVVPRITLSFGFVVPESECRRFTYLPRGEV